MYDLRLPRHVIDRPEHRWAARLQRDAKAWSAPRGAGRSACAMGNPTVRGTSPSSSDVLGVLRLRSRRPMRPAESMTPRPGTRPGGMKRESGQGPARLTAPHVASMASAKVFRTRTAVAYINAQMNGGRDEALGFHPWLAFLDAELGAARRQYG